MSNQTINSELFVALSDEQQENISGGWRGGWGGGYGGFGGYGGYGGFGGGYGGWGWGW